MPEAPRQALARRSAIRDGAAHPFHHPALGQKQKCASLEALEMRPQAALLTATSNLY
jgi:hypothetical protein